MKKINNLTFLLAFSLVLCGCNNTGSSNNGGNSGASGNNGGGDKETISFFGWGSAEEQENFQELVNAFMEDNPDIEVVYSAASSDSYMNVLKNKGKNLPDVFYIPDYEFMQWADSGKLLALDEYLSDEEINGMWDLSIDMYRYDRDEYKLGTGDLYGLPKDLGPYPLVYNKDLLKASKLYEKIDNISLGIGLCTVIGCLQNNRTRASCNILLSWRTRMLRNFKWFNCIERYGRSV